MDTVLGGLPEFLRLLNSTPTPATVIAALVHGPLAAVRAEAGILMHTVDDNLVMIASTGYAPQDLVGFEVMPIAAELPICAAVRETEIVVTAGDVVRVEYPDMKQENARWDELNERMPLGSIVSVPIVSQGVCVGAYGFTCATEREWGSTSLTLVYSVASGLGIWMTHPSSGLVGPTQWEQVGEPSITERQASILRLVAVGLSNSEIGQRLGYSESTVKQEVQRTLREFESPDRASAARRAQALGLLEPADGCQP